MTFRRLLIMLMAAALAVMTACNGIAGEPSSSTDPESRPFFSSRGAGGHFQDRKSHQPIPLSPEASSEIEEFSGQLDDVPDAEQEVTDYSQLTRGYTYSQSGKTYFYNPFAGILIDITGWTQMDLYELAESFDLEPGALSEWSGEDFMNNFVTPDLYAFNFDLKSMQNVMIMTFFENISIDDIAGKNRKEYLLFQMGQLASAEDGSVFSDPITVTLSGKEFIGVRCSYSGSPIGFTQYTLVRQYGDYMYNISIMGTDLDDIQEVCDLFLEVPDGPSSNLN
ncbi:MAG: hypothetical protein IJG64_03775 [Oscillospiraceae bacterium]|nr:hypothetical protein [Oscillospiraceae bacterium]